jgi:hypothetical protein
MRLFAPHTIAAAANDRLAQHGNVDACNDANDFAYLIHGQLI